MSAITALPLVLALRELRGGIRGFYVFLACIALGVMAIAGVASLSASLGEALSHEGRRLLGGDLSLALFQREASETEIATLRSHGVVSSHASLRAMARSADEQLALVEIKAVDDLYPLVGALTLAPALPPGDVLREQDGIFGAAADPALLARLDLRIGDQVRVGSASFTIRAALESEPDKLAGTIGFGPRLLISQAGLRATGLLQPGSLVRWVYRLRLPEGARSAPEIDALSASISTALPEAGWEIRTPTNASPQLSQNIERFTQFLTLVGLTALLVGGVGVANAVRSHLDRRVEVIAIFKSLGADGATVFAIYMIQVLILALIGTLIGLLAGAALPFLIASVFGAVLPLPLSPALHARELALALTYGTLCALAFALWPLGRVHEIPVAALFRDPVSTVRRWPHPVILAAIAAVAAALIAAVLTSAYDRRLALIFIAAALLVFAALRAVATLVMAIARHLPHSRWPLLRLAIANIHRVGALTPSVVLSLGLGLTVLVTLTQIDGNLRRQFLAGLPGHAPSFFFIDIPGTSARQFQDDLAKIAPGTTIEEVPMLRGRIMGARGVRAEELNPAPEAQWVLHSDRGLTYSREVPKGSEVVAGQWWSPDYAGPPLVSMEKTVADGLGLRIGDEVVVNVLGRNITARLANLRRVDWKGLGINFVLVFSPDALKAAPHTHIATLTGADPAQEGRIIREVARAWPMVTSVRVRDAIETVGTLITRLTLAIQGASAVTLIAALLVLGGALSAGQQHRIQDAVILKTVGATRARLIGAYALEYLLIGLATAALGVLAGSLLAWQIVTRLMSLSFVWQGAGALTVVAAALLVTLVLGLSGTMMALSRKPAGVLRDL
ncbi:MAG: FtsX-like permease family protein [Alphaproteobacteria bacterium]|nr:FtsX-like permease family protein [Alphaproteobacteria bacterium]